MKRKLYLPILFIMFFVLPQAARAQGIIYSISFVEQVGDPADPSSYMAGYGVMGMDYVTATFYNSLNAVSLYKDGQLVDLETSENYPYTAAITAAPLQANSVYTQFNDSGVRIIYIDPCSIFYDYAGLSSYAYSPYDETYQWGTYPSTCVTDEILYLGYTVDQEQATQAKQPCMDTCSPCKRDRRNRFIICATAGGACGIAAYAVFANAINNCENQAICNPASPMFNQQQCDNCKNSADNSFIASMAACGSAATACILTLPDCSTKQSCPTGPSGPPGPCN